MLNPTIEAIADIKVQVHTFDAEMGRTGGGVFNTTARSGGNTFHGTAFYQTRPVWGSALEYFAEKRGATKESSGLSESFYHLYGGGVGGPIVKNRTFFWFATEGYRDQGDSGPDAARGRARGSASATSRRRRSMAPRCGSSIPYCRGGVASGALSGDGDRLARDRRRVHQRDHPADSSGGESGGVQDGQLLAAAAHAATKTASST